MSCAEKTGSSLIPVCISAFSFSNLQYYQAEMADAALNRSGETIHPCLFQSWGTVSLLASYVMTAIGFSSVPLLRVRKGFPFLVCYEVYRKWVLDLSKTFLFLLGQSYVFLCHLLIWWFIWAGVTKPHLVLLSILFIYCSIRLANILWRIFCAYVHEGYLSVLHLLQCLWFDIEGYAGLSKWDGKSFHLLHLFWSIWYKSGVVSFLNKLNKFTLETI